MSFCLGPAAAPRFCLRAWNVGEFRGAGADENVRGRTEFGQRASCLTLNPQVRGFESLAAHHWKGPDQRFALGRGFFILGSPAIRHPNVLIGKANTWNRADRSRYSSANAIAVSVYSHVFNINPALDNT